MMHVKPYILHTLVLTLAVMMLVTGCGKKPSAPDDQMGTVIITGIMPNGSLADSVSVTLDDNYLGQHANPHAITLIAGKHLLEIGSLVYITPDSVIEYFGEPEYVNISDNFTIDVEFELATDIPVSPYAGYMAPDFTLTDLEDNTFTYADLSGKIVLLYFFSFT